MRRLLLGLFGAAALGLGALTAAPAPAQAQGFSITVGEPYGHRPVRRWHRPYERPVYYRPAPVYRAYPPRYARPVYYGGPRCTIRSTRHWNGYSWVVREREICR